jgi:hypothetical protein
MHIISWRLVFLDLINTIYNVLIIVIYHYNMLGQDLFWSISTLADPNANPNFNLTLTLLFSYHLISFELAKMQR